MFKQSTLNVIHKNKHKVNVTG